MLNVGWYLAINGKKQKWKNVLFAVLNILLFAMIHGFPLFENLHNILFIANAIKTSVLYLYLFTYIQGYFDSRSVTAKIEVNKN